MANVPVMVRIYAEGLEQPRGRIALTARTLREADATLLPHDPVGRNLSTDVLPNHVNNLLMGVAVGDPITDVARLVRAYRDAPWYQPLDEILGKVEPRQSILGGQTLGLDLDGLVNLLARPSENERRWRLVGPGRFRVSLVVGEALLAKVEDLTDGSVDHYKPHDPDAVGGQTFRLFGKERETAPFRRWAHLEFAPFEIAAALWGDSLKRGAVYMPSLDNLHASAAQEGKNAGDLCQETPAHSESRLHTTETDVSEGTTSDVTDELKSSQGSVHGGGARSSLKSSESPMPDHEFIRLTHLAPELVRAGLVERPPGYQRLYQGVLSGAFPAEQSDSGRWSVRRGDLPLIASALGLSRSPQRTAA